MIARRNTWEERFIEAFRLTGNVTLACRQVDVARQTVYHTRQVDPLFAEAWAEAEQQAVELLEAEARSRAVKGSDVLLIFLLKAHNPAKYRDNYMLNVDARQQTIVLRDAVPLDYTLLTDEELDDLERLTNKAAGSGAAAAIVGELGDPGGAVPT